MDALRQIQAELKAPKGQYNSFGKYKYRSCEDILEAVKPLLQKYGAQLTISDEMLQVGERYYIKATATIKDDATEEHVTAYARESEIKKGMDESQITGTASSYARKYALNGLFLIDDTKDADTDAYTERTKETKITKKQLEAMQELIDQTNTDVEKLCGYYKIKSLADMTDLTYEGAMSNLRTKAARA